MEGGITPLYQNKKPTDIIRKSRLMVCNEMVFLSFIHFPDNPDRINPFFYVLLRMCRLFIAPRTSYIVNEYGTGNPGSDTRCDVGIDPASITLPHRNIHGDGIPEHRIPCYLVVTTSMFCVYRWDVRRGHSHRAG
jgi:hypothetical protein